MTAATFLLATVALGASAPPGAPPAPSPAPSLAPSYHLLDSSVGGLAATVTLRSESVAVLPATAPVAVALALPGLVRATTGAVAAAFAAGGVAALCAVAALTVPPSAAARPAGPAPPPRSRPGAGADWRPD